MHGTCLLKSWVWSCMVMLLIACVGGCQYAEGWCFTTLICEQGLYIPWLMDRALRAGVSLQRRNIPCLEVTQIPGCSVR